MPEIEIPHIKPHSKIGLIGRNGSGKTTLLRKIATKNSDSLYVPQTGYLLNVNTSELKVFEYISTAIEEFWEVLEFAKTKFDTIVNELQNVNTLSGGELMKLHFSIAFCISKREKSNEKFVLLFDEPTNHIDLDTKEIFTELLKNISTSFVVASHDVAFLENVTSTIWDLENGIVKVHEQNYADFVISKENKLLSNDRLYEVNQKKFNKIESEIRNSQIKESKVTGKFKKFSKSNTDRFAIGDFKNNASSIAGGVKKKLDDRQNEIMEEMKKVKNVQTKKAYLSLKTTANSSRLLVNVENLNLQTEDGRSLKENLNFKIYYGDRIQILGKNGSGKTTLLREIIKLIDKNNLDTTYSQVKYAYLSQKYEIIDMSRDLISNMQAINNKLSYEEIRRILANFLFIKDNDISKLVNILSGGELARLCFAMISGSEIDLLLLDEPTNNLDLDTIEIIQKSLQNFKGGIVVISHNQDFVDNLKIENSVEL